MEYILPYLDFLPPDALEFVNVFGTIALSLWWLWLFLVMFWLASQTWLAWRQIIYKSKIKWTMFELRVPMELHKSPRAMEQVFTAIHAIRNSPSSIKEKWWDGEVTRWFSCEVVSLGGEIHFYLRVPMVHRNIIEAAIYSQYPDVELIEITDDYINRFPPTYDELEKAGYKLFANELKLEKNDAYPIRSYVDFEAIEEEAKLDPVSAIMEILTKASSQEMIWIQILVFPVTDDWKKKAESVVKDLKKKMREQVKGEGEKPAITWTTPSPGETEVLRAVERNLSKPGFDTLIRYVYVARPEVYDTNYAQRGIFSAFNQYASEGLNRFKHNNFAWTKVNMWYKPYIFPARRLHARRQRIYKEYRNRDIRDETAIERLLNMKFYSWGWKAQKFGQFVFNTESLATIYHPPTNIVLTGPLIKRSESRKVGPPAGLPIYGKEGERDLPGI